ncbi:MAG: hypothetical protein ABSA67_11250 [Candidatus Brocadiia bacterium]|jgi:hypothetical protein
MKRPYRLTDVCFDPSDLSEQLLSFDLLAGRHVLINESGGERAKS